jgi:hypothetical protein
MQVCRQVCRMDRRLVGVLVAGLTALAACSSGSTSTSSGQKTGQGIFALRAQPAAPGGETQVALHTLDSAGSVVTVISEFDYDAGQLQLKGCVLNPVIANAKPNPKALNFAEPSPGVLRAVVAGSLEPLPQASDVFTCTFAVAAGAPSGALNIQAHGDVSNASFEDRTFATNAAVTVGN